MLRIMSDPFPFGDVMMRKLQLFPWVIGLLYSPLAAQQRHTITHEDVFLMKRVGSPAISPDGRWIVFNVTEPSYTEGDQVSDLWLVPIDGSAEPRRLTNTKGGESGVDWSPDSRRIAFSARREGDDAAQIYVLDLSCGGVDARRQRRRVRRDDQSRRLDARGCRAGALARRRVGRRAAAPDAGQGRLRRTGVQS